MTTSLLDLTPDLLRAIAFWLPPKDRHSLAQTSRHIHIQTWGPTAQAQLTQRYPLETRIHLSLQTTLQSPTPFSPTPPQRIVPQRMRQQHLSLALSTTASLIALLPYDNRLRLLSVPHSRVLTTLPLSPPVYSHDLWDVSTGRRNPSTPRDPVAAYVADARLDLQITLDFSSDDSLLLVSGQTTLSLYAVQPPALRLRSRIALIHALPHLQPPDGPPTPAVGGPAALAPDGQSLAWVVFSGAPARVFLTFWDVASCTLRAVANVTTINPRRWSSLGWARVVYTPNGRYCVLIVNTARKVQRVERVGAAYQRVKLCKYVLALFDTSPPVDARGPDLAGPSSAEGSEGVSFVTPARERCEWFQLGADVYARHLGSAVALLMDGLQIHTRCDLAYNRGDVPLTKRQQLVMPSLTFNSLHSCPAEATYKGLSFGSATKHAWFIIKQPMYSLHFDVSGQRILVATSPHMNKMITLVRKPGEGSADEGGDGCGPFQVLDSASAAAAGVKDANRMPRRWRDGPSKRRNLFKLLPWRASFATVTAFSSNGKWVAGASLLDDDRCTVCLRNVTLAEYFN